MDGLYYYKLVSPYKEDVTKNCKLTVNEIDHNFFTLKESDIKKAEFVRSEDKTKSEGNLILTLNKIDEFSGENVAWVIPIDLTAEEPRNLAYDLKVSATEIEKNGTLDSSATAFASIVLPVLGGPTRRMPLGIVAPMFLYREGSWR